MNFIYPDLFNFVKNNPLKSKFKGTKKIAKDYKFPFDETAIEALNPQYLFDQLLQGQINLELVQVFALMGWENHQWTTKQGKTAMQNWWLSALDKDRQGEPIFRLVMTLRVILADNERYPAPKDVIQTMRTGLERLIQSSECNFKNLDVLQALISQNADVLANIAFKKSKSILQLMQESGFPKKLPIVKDAEMIWLKMWLNASAQQRKQTSHLLTELLSPLNLEQQQQFAVFILNHTQFNKPIVQLKQIVDQYPEIVHWLSMCDRDNEFRRPLELEEIQRLNCWVGTGNYQSLKNLLIDITQQESSETSTLELTEHRYIFWNNYQHLFRESWLLVPKIMYDQNLDIKRLNNVKIITGFNYPMIMIRIGQYYLLQMFILRGGDVDFIMINDTAQVELLLKNNSINYTMITQLDVCLIHDHFYNWQADLAYTLDKNFAIQPSGSMIDITKTLYRNYLQDVSDSSFKPKRTKPIQDWLRNAKHRWTNQQLQQAALTARRYHLV